MFKKTRKVEVRERFMDNRYWAMYIYYMRRIEEVCAIINTTPIEEEYVREKLREIVRGYCKVRDEAYANHLYANFHRI